MTSTATPTMNRRDLIDYIAWTYADFQADYPDVKIQPLDTEYAGSVARSMILSGQYRINRDMRYVDWAPHARDARKALPNAQRLVAMDRSAA